MQYIEPYSFKIFGYTNPNNLFFTFELTEDILTNSKINLILPNKNDNLLSELMNISRSRIYYGGGDIGTFFSSDIYLDLNIFFCKKSNRRVKYKKNTLIIPIINYLQHYDEKVNKIYVKFFFEFSSNFKYEKNVVLSIKQTQNYNIQFYPFGMVCYLNNSVIKYIIFTGDYRNDDYWRYENDAIEIVKKYPNIYFTTKTLNNYLLFIFKIKNCSDIDDNFLGKIEGLKETYGLDDGYVFWEKSAQKIEIENI